MLWADRTAWAGLQRLEGGAARYSQHGATGRHRSLER